ncbi:hypothetical protein EBZ37_12505 [bacterium]|nr:hypothetical protein [bacterium]
MVWRLLSRVFLFFLFIPNTYGYSLNDHAQLTRAAAESLSQCFPGRFTSRAVESMVRANQWEDQNLLRKWVRYSHFYNPEREFSSLRLTSRDRILDLETKIKARGPGPVSKKLIGETLHHIQDMSAPPHVIPVNHLWTDGFESLQVTVEKRFDFTSCSELIDQATQISLPEIHVQLAVDGQAVKQDVITIEEQRLGELSLR